MSLVEFDNYRDKVMLKITNKEIKSLSFPIKMDKGTYITGMGYDHELNALFYDYKLMDISTKVLKPLLQNKKSNAGAKNAAIMMMEQASEVEKKYFRMAKALKCHIYYQYSSKTGDYCGNIIISFKEIPLEIP